MRLRMFALALFALSAWGCGSGGSSYGTSSSPSTPSSPTPAPASNTLTVSIMGQKNDQSFNPNPIPLAQGGVVVWQNNDNTVHRIVMNDGSFDSGNIAPGAASTAMHLSTSGGSYHCAIHPTTMFGSINVATDTTSPAAPPAGY